MLITSHGQVFLFTHFVLMLSTLGSLNTLSPPYNTSFLILVILRPLVLHPLPSWTNSHTLCIQSCFILQFSFPGWSSNRYK